MIELAGYIMVFIIGLVMGTVGAGGSILTSSVLVYIFCINPVLSASYTLLNVAVISIVGFAQYYRKNLVDIKTGLLFALPALVVVFIMRRFVMPAVPATIISFENFTVTKDLLVMIVFALLMIVIAWTMIRKKEYKSSEQNTRHPVAMTLPGFLVGLITGFAGAGGGFVIVPALVFFAGLDIKKAVGTSLFIIAINTSFGFIGDYTSGVEYNWPFVAMLVFVTVAGMVCSSWLLVHISNERLKRLFAFTILGIGCWIITRELLIQ